MKRNFHFHNGQRGAALAVRVTPKARENKIIGITSDGTIRIHLKASGRDKNINSELISFLASILQVESNRVSIVAGETGNDKLVSVVDMTKESVHEAVLKHLA